MTLEYDGCEVMLAATGEEGVKLVEREAPDLVFLDIKMPGMDGLEVLQKLRHMVETVPIVVISGHADISTAVEATRLGAFDFIEKPLASERVLVTVRNAVDTRRLKTENRSYRKDAEKKYQIVGDAPSLAAVRSAIQKAAPTNATVLIWGESGVGKELVARAIHRDSLRRDGPFVQVNCAAIPDELIESELFGHEKGSFTGATDRQIGKFEQADKGTIFLDEVGDMSLKTQAKVLRVLQEQELERLGSNRVIKVDVRVIAATNKNLEEEIDKHTFREDLFYRLNVVPIHVPALRERRDDIPGAGAALRRPVRARQQLPSQDLHRGGDGEAEAAALARQHPRAAQLRRAADDHVGRRRHRREGHSGGRHHPRRPADADRRREPAVPSAAASDQAWMHAPTLQEFKSGSERAYLVARLRENGWNISKTAEVIDTPRSNLYKKLEQYQISQERDGN